MTTSYEFAHPCHIALPSLTLAPNVSLKCRSALPQAVLDFGGFGEDLIGFLSRLAQIEFVPVQLGALQDRLKALQFRFFGSEFLEALSLLRDQEMRPVYDFIGPAECGYHVAGLLGRVEIPRRWASGLVVTIGAER